VIVQLHVVKAVSVIVHNVRLMTVQSVTSVIVQLHVVKVVLVTVLALMMTTVATV
jgi:hypothetical protein